MIVLNFWLPRRVRNKALVNKVRREAADDFGWDVLFLQFVKPEIDAAVGVHVSQHISVNVGLRGYGIAGIWRQSVADGAGGAYNPSRKNAAVGAPVGSVENTFHEEVR